MLFGKKRSERELPDLPLSPNANSQRAMTIPSLDDGEKSLPSFPDSPTHNKFSQAAIKDAVGEVEEEEELPEFPELPEEDEQGNKMMEMEEWKPSNMKPQMQTRNMNMMKMEEPIVPSRIVRSAPEIPNPRVSDVFVKIDKYHTAKKSLNEIADKLLEIDNLIKRVRETKLREEQELAAWERDVAHIKARIQDVTENIFEKID